MADTHKKSPPMKGPLADEPVKLVQSIDKHRARFEDALVSLADIQQELKAARLELKAAQQAYVKARRAGPSHDHEGPFPDVDQ